MKRAIYMGKPAGWITDARLYRLEDPPFWAGKRRRGYVVVSGADLSETIGVPPEHFDDLYLPRFETYIFRTSRKGCWIESRELEGSFRGEIDHDRALAGLGYESSTGRT